MDFAVGETAQQAETEWSEHVSLVSAFSRAAHGAPPAL
jgi:hypothetical protein